MVGCFGDLRAKLVGQQTTFRNQAVRRYRQAAHARHLDGGMLQQDGDGRFVRQLGQIDDCLITAVAEGLARIGNAFKSTHLVGTGRQGNRQRGGQFDFEGGVVRIHCSILPCQVQKDGRQDFTSQSKCKSRLKPEYQVSDGL